MPCCTKSFRLCVEVETTREKYIITDVDRNSLVSVLKDKVESLVGIPSFLLQLHYMDECPLSDTQPLSYYHILLDGNIKARVWRSIKNLVAASQDGNWPVVQEELKIKSVRKYYDVIYDPERSLAALFIACFHGNANIVEKLLQAKVKYRKCLPSGQDAISIAASRDHVKCVELLLNRKVRPYEWNNERASLTNWSLQDRIKTTLDRIEKTRKIQTNGVYSRLTNSQKYDSALSTWYQGTHGQLYLCQILDGDKTESHDNTRQAFKP